MLEKNYLNVADRRRGKWKPTPQTWNVTLKTKPPFSVEPYT